MSSRPLFTASLAWNFAHGMSWLAVPLYAHDQGMSNAEVGLIIALPVFAQAPLNLLGGAFADRLGGRSIVLASAAVLCAMGAWLAVAQGFWMLLWSQVGLVLSRAIFWPAAWAMASELPGGRGVQLARVNAATNLGQIAGTMSCGTLLATLGFPATFAVLSTAAAVAFAAALSTQRPVPRERTSGGHLLAGYLPLLHQRAIHYAMFCAYLSGIPFALAISFYPLLFVHYGYGNDASGLFLALRSVGAFAAALLAARFLRSSPNTHWPVACAILIAAAIGFLPLAPGAAAIAAAMLLVGLGSGAMTLYFQMTISEVTRAGERSSALALGGMGWNVSMLTVPLMVGFVADRYGIAAGFYLTGSLTLASAAALAALRRWGS